VVRNYFDIRDDTGLYPDEVGLEFVTQRDAEFEAAQSLIDLVRDLPVVRERQGVAVEVRTDTTSLFQAALIFTGKTRL
jgi:hypothetical protein